MVHYDPLVGLDEDVPANLHRLSFVVLETCFRGRDSDFESTKVESDIVSVGCYK